MHEVSSRKAQACGGFCMNISNTCNLDINSNVLLMGNYIQKKKNGTAMYIS